MVSPDRLKLYYLTTDIPCLRPDQVDMDSWDNPLKETFQTFQAMGSRDSQLIEWNSWTRWGERHQGTSRFAPLLVPDEYRLALRIAVHGWGRTMLPDWQVALIRENNRGNRSGVALFISGRPFDPSPRTLLALADYHDLDRSGSIWIVDSHDKQSAGMLIVNAVQEAADRIKAVDQD